MCVYITLVTVLAPVYNLRETSYYPVDKSICVETGDVVPSGGSVVEPTEYFVITDQDKPLMKLRNMVLEFIEQGTVKRFINITAQEKKVMHCEIFAMGCHTRTLPVRRISTFVGGSEF